MSNRYAFDYKIELNENRISDKVNNNAFGQEVAQAWKDIISPYTPRDTGQTEDTAVVAPWTITYSPVGKNGYRYAPRIYYDMTLNFQKTHNPYATHHWDMAAEQAGKKIDLYNIINNQILKK